MREVSKKLLGLTLSCPRDAFTYISSHTRANSVERSWTNSGITSPQALGTPSSAQGPARPDRGCGSACDWGG